jgi:2-oxoglutarate ferredoxin oxidoreductase subunit gamma
MTVDDRRDVIFTGIGGQGVQLCSKVLANAAVAAGRHVMLSSYFGGEMRGGRTEATVITRDEPVTDLPPIVPRLEALIVLHPAFLGDALPRLIAEPLVVTDAWAWDDAATPPSLASAHSVPAGRVVRIPAREIAADLGAPVAAGLALVGAFAALTGVADDDALASATRHLVPPHRAAALEANLAALVAGAEAVRGTPVGIGS